MAKTVQQRASSGHKLGQLVGDWFEEHFVLPLLNDVADKLGLYLDHRFRKRQSRGDKIVWRDDDNNSVDYDFVMELGGSDTQLGAPVAFFECFWRRGSRHSKDKARDDSGKLLPMRSVYPTARFLGIVGAGEFTEPARSLIRSREIDLLYVPKAKVIEAFKSLKMEMDYPDTLSEDKKFKIATKFEKQLTKTSKVKAAKQLRKLLGVASIKTYADRVRGALGALPQELRFNARRNSSARVFETVSDAANFLASPDFDFSDPKETYVYQITYSDGSEFEREVSSLEELRSLHQELEALTAHISALD